MSKKEPTKVVQISNIAPQATKDQLQAILGMLGRIEEIRLYPTIRDVSVTVTERICYVRFQDHFSVISAQHLTNSVFIDRALICVPVKSGIIPEEYKAIEMANNGTLVPGLSLLLPDLRLPSDVVTKTEGQIPNQVLCTYDPKLDENGLPPYPPLPVNFDQRKLCETRRTILVLGVKSDWSADEIIDFFDERAGDVKYFRFALMDKDKKIAMIEFVRQEDIISALKLQGTKFKSSSLNLTHSTQPIMKPEAKSNEAAQKDIEDAMNAVVKDSHSSVTVAEPAFTLLASKDKGSTSRRHSRTRSPSLEVRSSYSRSKRSRSRKRDRRSRSRSRRKRSGSRRRSHSRSSKRRKRSTSRRRTRSPSRTRRHRRRERSRSRHKSSRNRSRSRDRRTKSRDRSPSRHRSEKKKKSHREKKEVKYSASHSRSKSPVRKASREPSREKASAGSSRRRSPDRKLKKISEERTRDYDAEEKIGLDDNGCEKSSSKSDNMDISP